MLAALAIGVIFDLDNTHVSNKRMTLVHGFSDRYADSLKCGIKNVGF